MARSRYNRTKVLDGNVFETFSLEQKNTLVREFNLFEDVEYIEYVVKNGDRLDVLAAKFLNNDSYWWVIALFNGLTMPAISPNQKIRIPTSVNSILDKI